MTQRLNKIGLKDPVVAPSGNIDVLAGPGVLVVAEGVFEGGLTFGERLKAGVVEIRVEK